MVTVDVKTLSFWVSVTVEPSTVVPVIVMVFSFVRVVGEVITGATGAVVSTTFTVRVTVAWFVPSVAVYVMMYVPTTFLYADESTDTSEPHQLLLRVLCNLHPTQ